MAAGGGPCLLVAALLAAWISVAAPAAASLSPEQEGTSQKSANCMPCSRMYVADAYLGDAKLTQHRGLTEIPYSADLCKGFGDDPYVPTLSELHQQLVGEGSHRHLVYSLKFSNCQDAMVNFLDSYDADLVIIENLPRGVFADPFELQHLVERKAFLDVAVFGDTNLELPSALSNWSAVEIHLDLKPSTSMNCNLVVELPLHARYPTSDYYAQDSSPVKSQIKYETTFKLFEQHVGGFELPASSPKYFSKFLQPLDASGYATVEFSSPDLILRYRKKETSHPGSCLWVLKDLAAAAGPAEKAAWRIPCGDEAHIGFVSTITFLSALVCSMSIVLVASLFS